MANLTQHNALCFPAILSSLSFFSLALMQFLRRTDEILVLKGQGHHDLQCMNMLTIMKFHTKV